MRILRRLVIAPLTLAIAGFPSLVAAQQRHHSVDPTTIALAVSQHVAQQDADRAVIREVLRSSDVRALTAKSGVDLDRLAAAVSTLTGQELAQAAGAAQAVNKALVGGQSSVEFVRPVLITALMVGMVVLVLRNYTDTCFKAECYQ